jgi:uncharacterized Tic20 family protein
MAARMLEKSFFTISERNWAMLAHLSALATVLAGFYTGGVGAVFALLLPLGMYIYFRERAPYAAFHALQATVFQALGAMAFVVGVVVVLLALILLWAVTIGLSLALVGVLLLPFTFGLTLVAALGLIGLPAAGLAYVLRGAYAAHQGERFEYPLVGKIVARTMAAPERLAQPANG